MQLRSLFLALPATALFAAITTAQQPSAPSLESPTTVLRGVPRVTVPRLDRPAIAQADRVRDASGAAPRFAIPYDVRVAPTTHGVWTDAGFGVDCWRLVVEAPGASHVNLGFTRYDLPPSAQLIVRAADGSNGIRPFTAGDNSAAQELWTPVVQGEAVLVELRVRDGERGNVLLELGRVGSGYRFFGAGPSAIPAPEGGSCNIDVNCPQGNAWLAEIPSVAAYSFGGSLACTGFMVNNTAQDRRNYFMTAYHCGVRSSNAASLVVYWNYQNTTCNGSGASLSRFNTGAVLRSGWSTSDFTLVELNSAPNPAWGVTYAGWDRSGQNASMAVGIHHPRGCPKKISFENQATTISSFGGGGSNTHVRVIDWDAGTTEPGSSGSPLFNQNHQVIGQLHGGGAACGNNLSDYYGRFSLSWNGGGSSASRLSNWLDPIGSGATNVPTLGGGTPGRFDVFGAGCAGTGQTPPNCVELNPNGGTLVGTTRNNEYAYVVSASGSRQVVGFDLYTRSTGGNVTVGAYLYRDVGGAPSASPVASTSMTIGATPGFYAANFVTPASVTGTFYISIDHSATTTVLSELTNGSFGSAFWRRPPLSGSWSSSTLVNAPSFKIRCVGGGSSNAVPQIGNAGVARVNAFYDVTLEQAAAGAPATLLIGLSRQAWIGGTLPFGLGGLGAPGCSLRVSTESSINRIASGLGSASARVAVPNNPTLVGGAIYHQWIVLDAGANALGLALTAGATSTIGD